MKSCSENEIGRLFGTIDRLFRANELAAVIVHMNDTYRIEERRAGGVLELPGIPRVAALVAKIREAVGEDRTLVLHSGDFLSPSYLSNRCRTYGRPMLELLNFVDCMALGNHEFDHDRPGSASRLAVRLRSKHRKFKILASNLAPPRGISEFERIMFWPQNDPFLAVIGLSGQETIEAASEHGFFTQSWKAAARDALATIRDRGTVGYIAVLSHLGRDEDKALQKFIQREWSNHGFAHIFGGHDHHIGRREPGSVCCLSKNLSNCATVSVSILTKTQVAAPPGAWGLPGATHPPDETDILHALSGSADDEHTWREGRRARAAEMAPQAVNFYRQKAKGKRPLDTQEAYVRYIEAWIARWKHQLDEPSVAAQEAFEWARQFVRGDFSRAQHSDLRSGDTEALFSSVPAVAFDAVSPLSEAQAEVDRWMAVQRRCMARGLGDVCGTPHVVADFPGSENDARDGSLRSSSTDFGNLVADAVEAATGADFALIHAGSFRIDQRLGSTIILDDLFECFIYDDPSAVIVAEFSKREITEMLKHARGKLGSGSFLQVSRGVSSLRGDGRIRTAIPAYLLSSDQDGYQSIVAAERGVDRRDLLDREFLGCERHSLIDLCRRGMAGDGVRYDGRVRLTAEKTLYGREAWMAGFLAAVDDYVSQCERIGLNFGAQLILLESSQRASAQILRGGNSLEEAIAQIHKCINDLFRTDFDEIKLPSRRVEALMKALSQHERTFAMNRDYRKYLSSAFEYVMQAQLRQFLAD